MTISSHLALQHKLIYYLLLNVKRQLTADVFSSSGHGKRSIANGGFNVGRRQSNIAGARTTATEQS
jgi:hypothetical protein